MDMMLKKKITLLTSINNQDGQILTLKNTN